MASSRAKPSRRSPSAAHRPWKSRTLTEEERLAANELGRQVLRLRAEREGLLDAIWLATSPSQVRAFWQRVGELLGEEPSRLERAALPRRPPQGLIIQAARLPWR